MQYVDYKELITNWIKLVDEVRDNKWHLPHDVQGRAVRFLGGPWDQSIAPIRSVWRDNDQTWMAIQRNPKYARTTKIGSYDVERWSPSTHQYAPRFQCAGSTLELISYQEQPLMLKTDVVVKDALGAQLAVGQILFWNGHLGKVTKIGSTGAIHLMLLDSKKSVRLQPSTIKSPLMISEDLLGKVFQYALRH